MKQKIVAVPGSFKEELVSSEQQGVDVSTYVSMSRCLLNCP